jgi:valyl-tRNA synthetase
MPHDLAKAYEPGAIETRWAEHWAKERLFSVPTPPPGETRPVFTLLLPPPNVTGRLHMGHMLNQTQMDIIVRWHRMRGFITLWLPGTDHAGIATQMMVERQLATEGKQRREMSREAFVARVWEWKRHYGGAILDQMKRLGASVDWDRLYFTMDDNLSQAVREAFVRLYEEGLIYRGKYIVNWCPRCETAISDLEVKHEETTGKLYEIRYPVVGSKETITVATTRPETMLGDTAVAVNPEDERYRHLQGRRVLLPLMNREIPVIADVLAQPEFGTGAVKVTPAHDANDFQAGLRHQLPQINLFDERARLNENAGVYAGLDRWEARKRIVNDLEEQGFLVGVKDYPLALAKCDRCGTVVEPRLSTQWFIKIAPLAERARQAVETGEITISPENYRQIYLNWMNNIYDWCISRQLWWGHRIPAWHCATCHHVIVSRETPVACTNCGGRDLKQDTDVLDTWFSSGLLPFTSLGWPEHTRDLEVFYPNSLMITGFDILFFWLARMIMFGCHFMPGYRPDEKLKAASGWSGKNDDSVPFRRVYIHALVRDADRQKMSKTKGNVLDPLDIIQRFGTDATRFTLAAMAAPGTDIAFNEKRTDGYRNFANKIWNAARFLFMNIERAEQAGIWSWEEFRKRAHQISFDSAGLAGFHAASLEDRWIRSRFERVTQAVHDALAAYRFHEAANQIYDFFWSEFCDWYIELIKPRLMVEAGRDEDDIRTACGNLVTLFEAALRLLHPIMPFITEELWHALYDGSPVRKSIALAPYPQADATQFDMLAETDMAVLQDFIASVRNLRTELKVEQKLALPVLVFPHEAETWSLLDENRAAIERLANVAAMTRVAQAEARQAPARGTARFDLRLVYEKKIDIASERERLNRELEGLEKEIANGQRQLGNQQFLAKAPSQVVEGIRRRAAELVGLREKAQSQLKQLE